MERKMEVSLILFRLDMLWISLDRVLTKDIRGDKDTAMVAMKQEVLVINFVSENMKRDKEIVMDSLNQYWLALRRVSNDVQGNK